MQRIVFVTLLICSLFLLVACDDPADTQPPPRPTRVEQIPEDAIRISIIYSPESDAYMPTLIRDFNRTYSRGDNPVTGEALADGEKPIYIEGQVGASATIAQQIANAILDPNGEDIAKPTIFQPSVRHWLSLTNFYSRTDVFDVSRARATANSPLVLATWASRINAILSETGEETISWQDWLTLYGRSNSWVDYQVEDGRHTVYLGQGDPANSPVALSTLITHYYVSAFGNMYDNQRLALNVLYEDVQTGVQNIQELIRHYSATEAGYMYYLARGSAFLDAVVLEESTVININRGETAIEPPERLVAIYPREGTIMHDHPFGIVDANWVTAEQQQAAQTFTEYVLKYDNQLYIVGYGFRPAITGVELDFPFEERYGVTVEGPTKFFTAPAEPIIAAIQDSWANVKKQSDIMLVVDVSEGMAEEGKLDQLKPALINFIEALAPTTRVGLTTMSDAAPTVVRLGTLETNKDSLITAINNLEAGGGTAFYDNVINVLNTVNDLEASDRIRSVIVINGSADSSSRRTFDDIIRSINASEDDKNPVIVIPVAYGSGAARDQLGNMASASFTERQSATPDTINDIMIHIASFF